MSLQRESLRTLAACGLLTAAITAQGGRAEAARQRYRDATQLHRAWLQENLDLDTQGAIAQYEKLRSRAPKARPERWIAIARLAELGRLGAIHPEPGTRPMQAPLEVQEALESLGQPVPWQNVLADPVAAVELPPLRPATERIMRWGRDQVGPTVDQRWLMQMRTRERSDPGDNRWRNRNAAFTLLDVELEGTSERAESLRRLLFAGWKPPKLDVDRGQAVARARAPPRDDRVGAIEPLQVSSRSSSAALHQALFRRRGRSLGPAHAPPVPRRRAAPAAACRGARRDSD